MLGETPVKSHGSSLRRRFRDKCDFSLCIFDNLAGGIEYTITEVQPFPYEDGADHLGNLGGEQADDMFRVVLPTGARGVNYNFTEVFGE